MCQSFDVLPSRLFEAFAFRELFASLTAMDSNPISLLIRYKNASSACLYLVGAIDEAKLIRLGQ